MSTSGCGPVLTSDAESLPPLVGVGLLASPLSSSISNMGPPLPLSVTSVLPVGLHFGPSSLPSMCHHLRHLRRGATLLPAKDRGATSCWLSSLLPAFLWIVLMTGPGSGPLVVSRSITCLQASIMRTQGSSASGIIWNLNTHWVLCNFGRAVEPWWKAKERETRARDRHWGAEGGRRHLGSVSLSR